MIVKTFSIQVISVYESIIHITFYFKKIPQNKQRGRSNSQYDSKTTIDNT